MINKHKHSIGTYYLPRYRYIMALVLESLDYYETIVCYMLIGSEQLLKCCAGIIHW